jgi:hypothetical protein
MASDPLHAAPATAPRPLATDRPALSPSLDAAEFARWYWLRRELAAFCRARGLPGTGSKQALAERIAAHLDGAPAPPAPPPRPARGPMPDRFTPETVIGSGWRCTRALRTFFEGQVGQGFVWNGAMRTFLAQGEGRTLAQAIERYRRSLVEPAAPIGAQFEFNRHVRAHRAAHPGASHDEVLAAWWTRRARRGD